ncbi:HlyD family secretion protein [Pseudonocardia spinosispora]|uniref:HlyD family secretion protein n=1 Tax=Pseudonocardia spinosispora TaxID=103441 RepID=UPI000685EA64|nr:efflux RND transporter periplasmic adaptor subunit [Pseudonocardia spinosispora]
MPGSNSATLEGPSEQGLAHPPADGRRHRLRRSSRIALVVVIVVTVLEGIAFGSTYLLYSRHYVTTDNAQVDGDKIAINAPATGNLVDWTINQGSEVHTNQIVGRVQGLGSGAQPEKVVRSPGNGTVAVDNAVNGAYVDGGTELATAYDFSKIYVTARVEDTDIADVHTGEKVDISVDAFPGVPVTGVVQNIQGAAASEFTIFPGTSTDPSNPQKVDQYVPVKIEFTNTDGIALAPGMNVTVHIHRR